MKHKTKRIYYFKIQGVPCAYVTFFEGGVSNTIVSVES